MFSNDKKTIGMVAKQQKFLNKRLMQTECTFYQQSFKSVNITILLSGNWAQISYLTIQGGEIW